MKVLRDGMMNKAASLLAILLITALIVLSAYGCSPAVAYTAGAGSEDAETVQKPDIDAGSCIVMSGSTSEIILDEHAERKLPMGSITKFMTAMVVIDHIYTSEEYSNKVEVRSLADKRGDIFHKGDIATVDELLKAMLIGDSDEAAEALARYCEFKRKVFIAEMNSKAMELGLMSTQYSNPTGAYDEDHYSTAEESAVVVQAAMRYSRIKEIMGLKSAVIQVGGKKAREIEFTSTDPLLTGADGAETYKYIKAGMLSSLSRPSEYSQYAGVSNSDGMQIIAVLLEEPAVSVAADALALLKYGDAKATRNTIIKAGKAVGRAKIRGGAQTRVNAYTETKGFAFIPPEGSTDLVTTQVAMFGDIEAPVKKGEKVGEYRIYVADELKGTVDLVTDRDVEVGWFPSKIYISNLAAIVIAAVAVILTVIILRLRYINKRKAKARRKKRQEKIEQMAREQAALDEDRRKRQWTYSKYYDAEDINEALRKEEKK